MEQITVTKLNETYLQVNCDIGIKAELEEYFKFEIPNAKFNPRVKMKVWDGYIKLFSVYKGLLHHGLLSQLKKFCETYEYELIISESEKFGLPTDREDITPQGLHEFVKSLKLPSDLEVRDYQYIAAYKAIRDRRLIVVSPTASGKSLTLYIIIRYMLMMQKRVMLMVPTTGLVAQMAKDFHEYSANLNHDIDDMIHQIYSGKEKLTDAEVTITTWQSIYKLHPKWFTQYDAVFTDEVHLGAAASLTSIMEKCTYATHKVGLTGSLNDSKTHRQMLIALYGDVTKVASTRELIDRGFLSEIHIECLLLKYSKDTSLAFKKVSYQDEMKYLIAHTRRNKFIRNLAQSLEGNTLILFQYVEKHGKVLYDMLTEKMPDRQIFFVSGDTDVDARELARNLTEKGENVIVVASVGVFSTGVNIKRLHNVIFASPTKSIVRVLQSIGRGLRKADDKDVFKLFDIADDLTVTRKAKKNYTYEHFKERLKIYSEQGFNYKITEIEIEQQQQQNSLH